MTFLELAEHVLQTVKKPLTSDEIWSYVEANGLASKLNTQGKTPWATMGSQLHVNAKNESRSIFGTVGSRPMRFYLRSMAKELDLTNATEIQAPSFPDKVKSHYLEKDLHPILVYFARYKFKCYSKTIRHGHSPKKEYGEWVHPDIVGCYFPFDEWEDEVFDLSSSMGNTSIDLYSFELKRELGFGNLRESFFQAVSNSTWANYSYLVAAKVSSDPEFQEELLRLSTSFGIGVIELNISEYNDSEILFQSKYREKPDWEGVNKLSMNTDFKEFLRTVKIDLSSKKVHTQEYDKVMSEEEMTEYLNKLNT